MEKKETSSSINLGMCQKLFNAFTGAANRPLRLLNFRHHQDSPSQPPPPPPPEKRRSPKPPEKKISMPVATDLPPPPPPPAAQPQPKMEKKVEEKVDSPAQQVTPPKVAPVAAPPPGKEVPAMQPRGQQINRKANEYITREKNKMKVGSNVGRTFSSK